MQNQNHSQSIAERLAKIPNENLQAIAKYGCCAFVLRWCLYIEGTEIEEIESLNQMITQGAIEKDCTVKWADAIRFLTGKKSKVDFVKIDSIAHIKARTPVRFDYNGKSHWVGVENGKVAHNSLKQSICVDLGKPTQARLIEIF